MPISGEGKKGILIVGEAPGEQEDEEGEPFVGKTGQHLERTLRKYDIEMREDCWITNALICHPEHNREPQDIEIDYCRPNVLSAIRSLNPSLILLVGSAASQSVIGSLYKRDSQFKFGRWVGWTIPSQRYNAWICPVWHPSFVLREQDKSSKSAADVIWQQHLTNIASLVGRRPWRKIPNYKGLVDRSMDPKRTAERLREFIRRGGVVSFDYETNMLKPDSEKSRIVSCAVSWQGKDTIAYPWHGEAIAATKELLRSDLYKVGANIKFEDRWTQRHLHCRVRNWLWDDILGAHLWDNRSGTTSVKFQAFVLLGLDSYDDHIHELLQADAGSEVNQVIEEIRITDLLEYNGIDALVEFKIAQKQHDLLEDIGWPNQLQNLLLKSDRSSD